MTIHLRPQLRTTARLRALPARVRLARVAVALGSLLLLAAHCRAGELVTLRNGFSLECDHRESHGAKTLLYLDARSGSYMEIDTSQIAGAAAIPSQQQPSTGDSSADKDLAANRQASRAPAEALSPAELHEMLTAAGREHDLNVDLLASVVHAESDGRPHAVSRAGAEGLMQLMPSTAASLGVRHVFAPRENVAGGTAYLNALLLRYHDNLALALAAYNAGPAAVDRWHGVPPYRETRAYVERIIHEFNARYAARQATLAREARATRQALAPRTSASTLALSAELAPR